MRIGAAELRRLRVHFIDKSRYAAFADVIRQHQRGVVSGRQHHAVQQFADGILLADMILQAHHGALGVNVGKDLLLYRHHGAVKVGYVIGNHNIGHDLGRGSGIHLFFRVFLKYDGAGIEVFQIYRFGNGADVAAVIDRRSGNTGRAYDDQNQQRANNTFHSLSPIFIFSL